MEVGKEHRVEIRRVGSEKAVVRVDKLSESEATKVYLNITFPTVAAKGEYECVIIYEGRDDRELVSRRREM